MVERATPNGPLPDGPWIDEQTQALVARLAQESPGPFRQNSVAVNRDALRRAMSKRPPAPVTDVTDSTVPGPTGDIRVRVYRPDGLTAPTPAAVFFHGGGWVRGDLDTHHYMAGTLAHAAQCVVIAVDYRRAPEDPYPAAVDDAIAAYAHIVAHANDFRIDPRAIAVAGDSSGANLAAAVCVRHKVERMPLPCFQLLICPIVDISREARSYEMFAEGFSLTRDGMRWFVEQYTPEPARRREVMASPILSRDLSGLPAAHIVVAGCDVLRDDGLAYAARLREVGVPTSLDVQHHTVHGFFATPGLDASDRAVEAAARALRSAFRHATRDV